MNLRNSNDLEQDDLRTIAGLGIALWVDREKARTASVDSLSAVALMNLTRERRIERCAAALLSVATKKGAASNADALGNSFYRLLPEERFVLFALHTAHWSYQRIARIIDEPTEEVERLAWNARLTLASSAGIYAAGGPRGPKCPEFDPGAPWTQRFLDDELQARELLFLQNHLMACGACRQTLHRGRELYYVVEKLLPSGAGSDEKEARDALEGPIARTLHETRLAMGREPMGFTSSIRIFLRRPDVIAGLCLLAAWILYGILR